MSDPFTPEQLTQLKVFVDLCISNPSVLHLPDLAFVKSFIEHFGGKLPDKTDGSPTKQNVPENKPEEQELDPESESEESDLELDMTGVIEPDNDEPQKMGDLSVESTEEQIAESQTKRSEAVSAFVEKDYNKAIQLYTEAILLNPQASLLYAKRGQIYLLLNKPNACIRDCDRALELNPDSAAAHKFRGRAYHLLGKWEEAANDLRLACKFDFDEQADEWLRDATPNARKIEEHKRKKERKLQEKLDRERQAKLKRAREAAAKAREEAASYQSQADPTGGGFGDFYKFLNDPEVMQAFQDPEIAQAFQDISSNPTNLFKYQSNPKIMALINKMASKFGGAGMGGGLGGMMGAASFASAHASSGATASAHSNPQKPKTPEDDGGLD